MRNGLMEPPAGMAPMPEGQTPPPQPPPPPTGGPAPQQTGSPTNPLLADATDPEDPFDPASYFDGGRATADEQTQYEYMMGQAMAMIHGEETAEPFAAALGKASMQSLPQVIGFAALSIFTKVEEELRQNGRDVFDSVRLEVGESLLEELIEVATAMGKLPDDEETAGVVFAGALDVFASRLGKAKRDRGNFDGQGALDHMEELMVVANKEFPIKKVAESVYAANQQMAADRPSPSAAAMIPDEEPPA